MGKGALDTLAALAFSLTDTELNSSPFLPMAIPRLLFYKYEVPVVALSVGMFVFTPDMPALPRWLELPRGGLHQKVLDLLLPSSPATALQHAVHWTPRPKQPEPGRGLAA